MLAVLLALTTLACTIVLERTESARSGRLLPSIGAALGALRVVLTGRRANALMSLALVS